MTELLLVNFIKIRTFWTSNHITFWPISKQFFTISL